MSVRSLDKIGLLVGAIVLGFALFSFLQTIGAFVVAPLVMVFASGGVLEAQSFSVNGSEFRYGAVLESAIVLALATGVFFLGGRWLRAWREKVSENKGS